MITLISFIIVLGIIVLVHEFGHYAAAKLTGMKVEVFSIGFGKKLIGKKIGETEYRLAWIPLGGYVKISGMVDESLDPEGGIKGEPYEFESKSSLQKGFVITAGVLMNFLLAIFIYSSIILFTGIGEADSTFISQVIADKPAEKAGLLVGDKIVEINNTTINTWQEMSKIIHSNPEQTLNLVIEREQNKIEKVVIPEAAETLIDGAIQKVGLIGIAPKVVFRDASLFESLSGGVETTVQWTKVGILSIKMLVTGEASLKDLGGPIMIAEMSGKSAKRGIQSFLAFIAFISINIGFLNILPIPMLDGGHLVYIIIEGVTRKKISTKIKLKIQQLGMAILLTLMIFAVFNDISRVFTGKGKEIEKEITIDK